MTLLASIPTLSSHLRGSINRNLKEIVELHEELLGDLHNIVPQSEYASINDVRSAMPEWKAGHTRWHSLDAVPDRVEHNTWLQCLPDMTAEPKIVAAVAKSFAKRASWPAKHNQVLTMGR